jgi:hypothetical protein
MDKTAERPAPKSTDLAGWHQAVAENRLGCLKLEAITAAFQDLRRRSDREDYVEQALIKYLSDSILRTLRKHVGTNHPDGGREIILRAHHQLIAALLKPGSADGKGMRVAFASRVIFRMKDALVVEFRERHVAGFTPLAKEGRPRRIGKNANPEVSSLDDSELDEPLSLEACSGESEDNESGDDELASRLPRRRVETDESRETCEQIDVDRILSRIRDFRKRLAFQLYLKDVPFKSKRPDVDTIAKAVGISERTARAWVQEVIEFLQTDEEVLNLWKLKVGEKS